MNNIPLVVILYDSITNSVFESQVVIPLIRKHSVHTPITIISFEKKPIPQEILSRITTTYPTITLLILKRFPLVNTINLYIDSLRVKKILRPYKHNKYTLQARGPLAGFIALAAYNLPHCTTIIIQARSLLAEEYRFSNPTMSLVARYRYWLFKSIETAVYQKQKKSVIIEAVSPALQKYLIETYSTPASSITIAEHDTPTPIQTEQIHDWRLAVRSELNISETSFVYCYNGSIKPWQQPEQVIEFFTEEQKKIATIFLLILTQDTEKFIQLLQAAHLAPKNYCVLSVAHQNIYRYLAASDAGIIFREPDIVNWTSRPTKVLEYQAVGLKIIHNNTVGMLVEA